MVGGSEGSGPVGAAAWPPSVGRLWMPSCVCVGPDIVDSISLCLATMGFTSSCSRPRLRFGLVWYSHLHTNPKRERGGFPATSVGIKVRLCYHFPPGAANLAFDVY